MDNAAYHKHYELNRPKPHQMNHEACMDFLHRRKVEVSMDQNVTSLRRRIRNYISTNEEFTVRIAYQHGHRVIFTPPYESTFQPIELVWGYVKKRISDFFSRHCQFKEIEPKVQEELKNLVNCPVDPVSQTNLIERFIHHSEKALQESMETIELMQEEDGEEDDISDCDDMQHSSNIINIDCFYLFLCLTDLLMRLILHANI